MRLHAPGWDGAEPERIQDALAEIPGVIEAVARPATGNVLVRYDPGTCDATQLVAALARITTSNASAPAAAKPGPPPARTISDRLTEQAGRLRRVRIPVAGIDRDPRLARRVVEVMERRADVKRAVASATTGRVLVEFSDRVTDVRDLLADLSKLDLPDIPPGDRPSHPLDPAPIVQSGARLAGAALGLAALGLQRLLAGTGKGAGAAATAPAAVAGAIGIVDGAPPIREALCRSLGRDRMQLLLGGTAIASLTLSGSPLGLLVAGSAAMRTFTETRARRQAWRDYEHRLEGAPSAQPGTVIVLESGSRVPLDARVMEGRGALIAADGLPDAVAPGTRIAAGARVASGTLTVELIGGAPWEPRPRPAPPRPGDLERYLAVLGPLSAGYALLYAAVHRSPAALFTGLLLVNPRAALIGAEAADTGASARVLRAGVTVVGTRPDRVIRRPDVLIIDGPRVLTDGVELARVEPAAGIGHAEAGELVDALPGIADCAELDGTVGGRHVRLVPARSADDNDESVRRGHQAGDEVMLLRDAGTERTLAYVHLRPKLAAGLDTLRDRCHHADIELAVLERGDRHASRQVARRADVSLILEADLLELVRDRQRRGERVAVLSDSACAGEAFDACDLAIALSSGRSSPFQARADLLAPGLPAVAGIIAAAVRHDEAVARSIVCSLAANLGGALWGLRGEPGVVRASQATYLGALAAIGAGWARLRGGRRARSIIARLTDPRPERWGRMEPREVLAATRASEGGLSRSEASARRARRPGRRRRNSVLAAVGEQLESPLVAVLGAGAVLSLAVGAVADVAIIASVIVANACVGAWQERQAGQAAQALERLGAASARVLRDGDAIELPAEEIVRGDILLVGSGDRIVADARLLEADALEVDEASLTGESLPVGKSPDADVPAARILLEGSDVTVGTGRAVVVAVGPDTRLGATAAALAIDDTGDSPLGRRLDRLFHQGMPLVAAGGALVALAGIAWGGPPLAQLAVGASVAVAAVPEGLPLLAGVAEASVARRLAARSALVRRLTSVEALGRVDVACCDKTGTLTQGRLAVTLVDDLDAPLELSDRAPLGGAARQVLAVAGLASPASDAPDAAAHPTDRAILAAAADAGLGDELAVRRTAEAPFDPARALHATATERGVAVKGAAEAVAGRCARARGTGGRLRSLDDGGRRRLLERAEGLAARGLRVLMVAEGPPGCSVDDPGELTAVGFVGITDPLRPGAARAIRRCRDAGVRVVMLTGDHPATARAVAEQAGLPVSDGSVVTGEEIAALDNGELGRRLADAAVVARITPVDKLRIVDALQRAGHTVAMTGDGVNDAPALRLADVGVAMGAGGTEVARQAADVVIADDRFETLTEALLEGRSLWRNLHRALGLLLGGNLGEVGLMAGAALLGRGAVLGARQVLAVNLVTDVLPAVAVAVQAPQERALDEVAREGAESFDRRLVRDIARRGAATAAPALVAVLAAPFLGAPAPVVAYASIIVTQLAQTLRAGEPEQRPAGPVLAAVAASGGVLGASLFVPPLRRFLALPVATPTALALATATGPAAVALAGALP